MAFCSKCGAPIAEDEKTCSVCGNEVRNFNASEKIPPQTPPAFHENAPQTVRPKFCGKCGAAVCGEESVCGSCGTEIKVVPAKFYSQQPDLATVAAEKGKMTAKNIKKQYNVLSIVCLVTSFVPLFFLGSPTICLVLSAVVIIMGIVALNQIKNSGLDGKIFAVFGIIIGSVVAFIGVVMLAAFYIVNYALGMVKATFSNFLAEAFDSLINNIL